MPIKQSAAPVKELSKGCEIKFIPEDRTVVVRRGTKVLALSDRLQADVIGEEPYGLHPHTIEEERRTLVNRHLFATPPTDKACTEYNLFKKRLANLANEIGYQPIATRKAILKGKGASGAKRMGQGFDKYFRGGTRKGHSRIKEMQKLEFYKTSALAGKENRGIQYRDVVYNAALSRHLWHIEHKLRSCKGSNSAAGFLAKGQNLSQRAITLLRQARRFRNPVWILLDHSRFDAHVNKQLLRDEHSVYNRVRRWNPELVMLLKQQLHNRGETHGGIIYETSGKRMSGDVNTALGNSILNYAMLGSLLDASRVDGEIFLDGDDSVVTIESDQLDKLVDVKAHMLKLGMVTEFEVVTDISKVEFCQSRIVWSRNGPWMCPNPSKRISTMPLSCNVLGPQQALELFAGKVACELGITDDVPLMRPYVELVKQLSVTPFVPNEKSTYRLKDKGMHTGVLPVPTWVSPSDDVRLSFWKAWDITPEMQLAFEKEARFDVFKLPDKPIKHRQGAEKCTEDWMDGMDGTEIPGEEWENVEEDLKDWIKSVLL